MGYILQIGVIVRDLDRATAKLMELFQINERPYINKVGRQFTGEVSRTVYKEDTASEASCMTCCFDFENIQLEFIQPVGDAPSEWQRFLDEKGEGIHHLGFRIEDVGECREKFASLGYEETQSGCWGEGEYHYFDTAKALGFVIENMKFYT